MTDARTRILDRLKGHRAAPVSEPKLPVRRFDWTLDERLDRFQRMLEAVRAEVHRVGDDWPRVLAKLLRQKGVGNLRHGPEGPLAGELTSGWPPEGPALVRHEGTIETCRDDLFGATDAALTSCRGAIAETGSLVLWPSPAEPRLLSLVPPIHCVLINEHRILSTLHEMMVTESWADAMPTNALLISGPSKSADIEQTLAYGVHGPECLMVLVRRSKIQPCPGAAGHSRNHPR